ncbi:MAG: hypothetical protein AAF108_01860 [Planctomycetota bacterium]
MMDRKAYRGWAVGSGVLAWIASALPGGVAAADETFSYDDGISNVTFGPPPSFAMFGDIDVLWGNYFFTGADPVDLTTISYGLGSLSSADGGNDTVSIWIFDDADNDADPTNAIPIFQTTVTGADTGFDLVELAIDPVRVSGGFFVALGHVAELNDSGTGYPSPARFDPNARADRSWFFYDSDIPEDDLASSGFFTRMDGPQVPIQGAFAIRAGGVAVPGTGSAALLAMASLGSLGRRRDRSTTAYRGSVDR